MSQGGQGLLGATLLPPRRVPVTASGVDEPGGVLDQLMGDSGHGPIRNRQGPSGRRRAEWGHHVDDEGPCLVTTPADQLIRQAVQAKAQRGSTGRLEKSSYMSSPAGPYTNPTVEGLRLAVARGSQASMWP